MPVIPDMCRQSIHISTAEMPNPERMAEQDGPEILRRVMLAEVRIKRCDGFPICTWDMTAQPQEENGEPGYLITAACEGGRPDCPKRIQDSLQLISKALTEIVVRPLIIDEGST